jgi:hypothetical protein
MSEINHFKVSILCKMMLTSCICREFILVGTNYIVITGMPARCYELSKSSCVDIGLNNQNDS